MFTFRREDVSHRIWSVLTHDVYDAVESISIMPSHGYRYILHITYFVRLHNILPNVETPYAVLLPL